MSRAVVGTLLLVITSLGAACDDTPTAPTDQPPESPVVSETFAGTVTVNGAVTHPFVVATPAAVQARLQNVSPLTETAMGFSMGTWNTQTQSCTTIISNDNALTGAVLIGSATTSGAFCVRVYDVGKLTAPNSYEVVVEHR
jgi:hypothetical protein